MKYSLSAEVVALVVGTKLYTAWARDAQAEIWSGGTRLGEFNHQEFQVGVLKVVIGE